MARLNQAEDNLITYEMELIKIYTRFLLWSILLVIIPLNAHPQENVVSVSQSQDSLKLDSNASRHSLYTSLGYGNNLILGSTYSQDQPFYYGSLIYGYNNEIFASVSTFHLSAFEPFLAYHTFALNYSHVFNSWFDISLGASRYQIASELADTLFNSFFYGDLTIGVDWKLIYSKLSVGGLFAETSSAYFQIRNSRYFQTPEFFSSKASISFDPYVSLLFGSLTETKTADGTSIGITSPFHTSGTGRNSSGGSSTTSTIIGLMEIDLGLPVGLNLGKLTIEAEPGYVIPMYTVTDMPSPKGFVFTIGCTYRFF